MVVHHWLILSASALATFAIATPTPITASSAPAPITGNPDAQTDPCSILGGLRFPNITYKAIENCYRAIPFDRAQAATTLSTLQTLFKDYYVFTDAALSRKATKPFASEPVDILGELKKIGRKKYTSDYQFQEDIRIAIDTLRDGHAKYYIDCYRTYSFSQEISLYAPVIDGRQSIRVFRDAEKRGYEDCKVNTINGQNAFSYLRNYAKNQIASSHDPNARLNFLLAAQKFDLEQGKFDNILGKFAYRVTLPETDFVEYQLQCSNSSKPINLREKWTIYDISRPSFTDSASYVSEVCLRPVDNVIPEKRDLHRRFDPIPHFVKRAESEPAPATTSDSQFPGAELILAGNATVFYQLKDQPHIGVLVCHTFDVEVEDEKRVLLKGLQAFHDRNVTNIVVDFQGNSGGFAELSLFLVQMLFPNKHSLDAAFESDIRVSKSLQQLTSAGFNKTESGFYDAHGFINLASGERYQNNDLYDKPVRLTRNGRRNLYTNRTILYFDPVSAEYTNAIAAFPWTGKAKNIRILTDGRCGSACGTVIYFWTALHGVEAYSIGGTKGEDLSMFSAAGASVNTIDWLQSFFKDLNLTSPMVDLPYRNYVTFSWLEKYGKGRTTPFEYDAELYRPKHRLDYTPENARNREVLWKEVAAAAWK